MIAGHEHDGHHGSDVVVQPFDRVPATVEDIARDNADVCIGALQRATFMKRPVELEMEIGKYPKPHCDNPIASAPTRLSTIAIAEVSCLNVAGA